MKKTLASLLAEGNDEAPALSAPARQPLSFGGLRALTQRTLTALNNWGIGRNDRVAIVLANGPEMASCFIAVAAGAACAPLNPNFRAEEFSFYLTDLRAKALIVERGSTSPAIAVARGLGIRVGELVPDTDGGAGSFHLDHGTGIATAHGGYAGPDDIALVLHTSGTTARPKLVPLSQRNLATSAQNIRNTLHLMPHDCGLNIMPLFHIHGLLAGVLAPIAAGSRVFCTPGLNALRFFSWMDEACPTWMTAVPTMYQMILTRAHTSADVIARNPLRFMRSSSSPMPPKVMLELERVFCAPLLEAYGMTEAAHQMTSNPLPPATRKPGTVGLAAGPEVRVLSDKGQFLPPGIAGEIVIRGESVSEGYESNFEANAEAFSDGWFHTGDEGMIDSDGYISITGRLKEIINRGGEKISPREVDEILLDHPAVAQVVCFSLPHERLGEEVAAAVVLNQGQSTTERELQQFVGGRAADFKIPRTILFMPELPKGATGKLQRIGLAQVLGLDK